MEWYDPGLIGGMEGVPKMPPERVFLFRGKDGPAGQATTTAEVTSWVLDMVPALPKA